MITSRLLLPLLLLYSSSLLANTMYVTDRFEIYMRSGESAKHRILKTLRSGDEVKVLETNRKTGYSKIELKNGKTGYVLSRQLMEEQIARQRVPALEARIAELEAEPGELNKRLNDITAAHTRLGEDYQQLSMEKRDIELELAELRRISADALQIDQERRDLRKQVATMTHQIEDQKQQINEMNNSSIQRWFLIGAGVLLGGILLGLILPNLKIRKRKDSWGSF